MRQLIIYFASVAFVGGFIYTVASLFYTIPAVLNGKTGREAIKEIPPGLRRFGNWCLGIFIFLLFIGLFVR